LYFLLAQSKISRRLRAGEEGGTEMSEPLKPCPFCGCEMNQQGYFVEGNHAYKCLFQDKAIRATTEEWNPRAEAAETRELQSLRPCKK
jgi:hypothetical protein